MALHRAAAKGYKVEVLLTMLTKDGARSRSNGVALSVLEAQASALGVRLLAYPTEWPKYEQTFHSGLAESRRLGAEAIIFGDISGAAHRRWNEQSATRSGLESIIPLWEKAGSELISQMEREGYRARITAVKSQLLDSQYLGRYVDSDLAEDLQARGIDPCGENGEYHTVVVEAPMFACRIPLVFAGATLRNGYWHSEAILME